MTFMSLTNCSPAHQIVQITAQLEQTPESLKSHRSAATRLLKHISISPPHLRLPAARAASPVERLGLFGAAPVAGDVPHVHQAVLHHVTARAAAGRRRRRTVLVGKGAEQHGVLPATVRGPGRGGKVSGEWVPLDGDLSSWYERSPW